MIKISNDLIGRASQWSIGELLTQQVRRQPNAVAIEDGSRTLTYGELNDRVNRLAGALEGMGVRRGDRIAVLSENRAEYIELTLASAKLGSTLCALNWRLAKLELTHCIKLAQPSLVVVSSRFADALANIDCGTPKRITFGDDYERRLRQAAALEPDVVVEPEDGLLILYTSGTTGLPKGALISHRAELARLSVSLVDLNLRSTDSFVAWAPMFHMVSIEHALHVLCVGGKVIVVDGADIPRLVDLIETEDQWWLVLIPGMIDRVVEEIKRRGTQPKRIKMIGALADLMPGDVIGELTQLLKAPFWNTFGSTETGMLPVAGTFFSPGTVPNDVSKAHNSFYLWRLVNEDGRDVEIGQPGEIAVRGPTVFSGYWNAEDANAESFRNGWFHMGDLFVENPDGTLSFTDRAKYLIKSGGENIYPAEIERTLLKHPSVAEAVVVRQSDEQWGEVPIAFVALKVPNTTQENLIGFCYENLSSYKCPRRVEFVDSPDWFPRSTSGKIQRHEVEKRMKEKACKI